MAADVEKTRWGPFSPALSHFELVCRLRVVRAFCQVYVKNTEPVHDALVQAESGELSDVEMARIEFDRLPALTGRKVLGHYAEHWKRTPKIPLARREL